MKTRSNRQFNRIRTRIARWFFNTRYGRELLISSIGPRVQKLTVDCGDHVMTFSPHDYIGRKIFRKGHFERDHVDRLIGVLKERRLVPHGSSLLELGGNIGTQTVYFALNKTFSHIITVEPDPRNFELLRTNITQNRLADRVTLVNCAAGENQGEIDFFQHQHNHGKSSASRQSVSDCKIVVPVKPVSSILAEAGTDPDDIGLVWMDIEGYEPLACRSMQILLARKVPLYMEFSPAFYGPDQSAAFVQYLSRFYEDCLLFREDAGTPAKVREIPINESQFDVLLFDAAI